MNPESFTTDADGTTLTLRQHGTATDALVVRLGVPAVDDEHQALIITRRLIEMIDETAPEALAAYVREMPLRGEMLQEYREAAQQEYAKALRRSARTGAAAEHFDYLEDEPEPRALPPRRLCDPEPAEDGPVRLTDEQHRRLFLLEAVADKYPLSAQIGTHTHRQVVDWIIGEDDQ